MAFQSNAWQNGNLEVVDLQVVHRQKNMEFVLALSDMRRGILSPRLERVIQTVQRPLPHHEDGIESTVLFCHNRNVDKINEEKLWQLPGDMKEYAAEDRTSPDEKTDEQAAKTARKLLSKHSFWKSCRAPKLLQLKVGAQVMLLKNVNQTAGAYLVNGSRGVVEGFDSSCGPLLGGAVPVVRFRNGLVRRIFPTEFTTRIPGMGACIRFQMPLVLAWAVTIHKSQGMSMDRLKVDLRGVFDFGQSYVALSRARFMETLEVERMPLSQLGLFKNQDVEDFCEDLATGAGFTKTRTWKQMHPEAQPSRVLHTPSRSAQLYSSSV
eukprot:Plantae.Rhodophyta-Purpureofilum_apyrenoidigerum.ctg39352.p1 GENE.Plantae.Rhodophyta-Purpureofilum_apyrenoidigerum.ctg39352~~Plantae.Rhodophyta-Purpureofilum_apyrenoidigerum.ctg39352.p1  ORF type:complete len:322 (-),score=45.41 Plantae.Rhodophyta-Purpureofilum_apyrenoidigerum.ctg39352:242-1207(-)